MATTKRINPRKPAAAKKAADTTFKTEGRGMTIEFEVTEYVAPERVMPTRPKLDNPYEGGAKRAVELMEDKTKQLTVRIADDDVKKHIRWIQKAVSELGFSASIVTGESADGKTPVSFRAVKKITRKKKGAETTAETTAETAPAK